MPITSRLIRTALVLGLLVSPFGCKKDEAEIAEMEAAPEPISITIEIDQLTDTPRFPDSIEIDGEEVTLRSIFAPAGVELRLLRSDSSLPKASPLNDRDLEAWMEKHRDRSLQPPFVYCLIADEGPKAISRGAMFAAGKRNGVAVFTHDLAGLDPARRDREMVRRLAHELAHAFNLHHSDLEGGFRANGTIESSSDESTVLWHLSRHSLEHFAHHPHCELLPESGAAFRDVSGAHASAHQETDEIYNLRDCASGPSPAGPGPAAMEAPLVTAVASAPARTDDAASPLRLELIAKSEFALGEPVTVKVVLRNTGGEPVEVSPALSPEEGLLNVEITGPGERPARAFVPLSLQESSEEEPIRLTGEISRDVKLFFGAEGWTFREPGRYRLLARYRTGEDEAAPQVSAELELEVTQPDPHVAAAVQDLIDDPDVGRFLLFEGAAHLDAARRKLLAFVEGNEDEPQTPMMLALLALDAAEPAIDPETGLRLRARPNQAGELLARLRDPQVLETLPLSTYARARLQQADLLRERGEAPAARRALADMVEAVREAARDADQELVFSEQEAREVLEEVVREIPGARRTLETTGLDVGAVLDEGGGGGRP